MLSASSHAPDRTILHIHILFLQLEPEAGEQVTLNRNLPTNTTQDGSGHAPRQRQRES